MTTAPSPTGAALLRACLLAPADDAPRLVFADWLDENAGNPCSYCWGSGVGEGYIIHKCLSCDGSGLQAQGRASWAEFIRVQCELASDPERVECQCVACQDPAGRQAVCAIRRRERALWSAWGRGAPSPFAGLPGEAHSYHYREGGCVISAGVGPAFTYAVRRGFVHSASGTLAGLLHNAHRLWDDHPVESVPVTDRRPQGDGAGNWRWFRANGEARPFDLRLDLFRLLPGHDPEYWICCYPTAADAQLALSDALVAHGRAMAGLTEPAHV